MKNLMLFFFMWILVAASCKKEEDKDPSESSPIGSGNNYAQEMTFDISGNINESKNGQATASLVVSGNANIRSLDGNDGPMITDADQTYSISFECFNPSGEVAPFEVGTYTINDQNLLDPTAYTARLTMINSANMSTDEYGGIYEHQGLLEVTSINSNKMQGSFSFTAKNENGEEITVSNGEFNARILYD